MDLNFSAEEQQFREQVRGFLREHLPADLSAKVLGSKRLDKDDFVGWQKMLHAQGWGAPSWPKNYGGTGWNAVQQLIFDEECSLAGAPVQLPFGLKMVGPVIMTFGSAAQQRYFLPRIVDGSHWWCQGYSEPGAGSDLASLKTRAVRTGAVYVVNGQKTWNTLGQYADWIFCLVRTSSEGRPQEGISFLLIDMKSPGVRVRPIRMLDGEHEINEIWLEDVKVPAENLVGDENRGWTYAKFLLGHERTGGVGIGFCKRELKKLKDIANAERSGNRPLIEEARFRDRIAQAELELMALEITTLRVVSGERHKKGAPGPEASILKVKGSELQQQIVELQMQALGPYALPWVPEALDAHWHADDLLTGYPQYAPALSGRYFNFRKTSIFAGSNEIQKNIISQMILGL
ncbi:MAG TPA: acyl-CoA dehydrogenase family protein [Burkholderiaceae bacterium]|nr:acyl-CoA dehydrogenase family protein [Burkholderiaceae bacterium]